MTSGATERAAHERPLQLADVAAAVALARAVGWTDDLPEWRVLLACGDVRGRFDGAGGLMATCAVSHFGAAAALGKMIVRPDAQRRGHARALLEAAMAAVPAPTPLGLVATEDGWPLYRQLGFEDVGEVVVLVGPGAARDDAGAAGPGAPNGSTVAGGPGGARPLVDGDWTALLALDRARLGCDRARLLAARRAHGEAAAVVDGPDGVAGFALATAQGTTRMVGPVIAPDAETAMALVHALAAGAAQVRVDVPLEQADFAARLERAGFVERKRRREMSRGGARLPWQSAARFGLAAQAYG